MNSANLDETERDSLDREILKFIGEPDDSVVTLPTNAYKTFDEPVGNTKDSLEGLAVYHKTSIESLDYSGYARAKHSFGDKTDLISLFFSSCTLEIEGKHFDHDTVIRFTNKKIAAIRVFDERKHTEIKDGEPIIIDIRVLPPVHQWKNDDDDE